MSEGAKLREREEWLIKRPSESKWVCTKKVIYSGYQMLPSNCIEGAIY